MTGVFSTWEDGSSTPAWVKEVAADRLVQAGRRPRVIIHGQVVSEAVRSRSASSPLVDFRPSARARFEIRLLGESVRAIETELARVAPYRLETGGYLWSHYPNRLYSALVCHASGPAHNSKHERRGVYLGDANDVQATMPDTLQRAELIRVGDWHLHPTGDPRPSEFDRRAWASVLSSSGRRECAGIVVTPSVDGSGPQLHGWLTRTDGAAGRYVCEPAKVSD